MLSGVEIKEQEEILTQNGTVCMKCGELFEDLIQGDGTKVLKQAPGKPRMCNKCKCLDTGYTVDVTNDNEVIYKSPLEDGFMPVESEDDK